MRASPVNKAIRQPRTQYGVSPKAMGYIWGPPAFTAVLIGPDIGWLYATIPIGFGMLLHAMVKWAYKKDHRVFAIYAKYAKFADEYHPHSREKLPDGFERPRKVGRGIRT